MVDTDSHTSTLSDVISWFWCDTRSKTGRTRHSRSSVIADSFYLKVRITYL